VVANRGEARDADSRHSNLDPGHSRANSRTIVTFLPAGPTGSPAAGCNRELLRDCFTSFFVKCGRPDAPNSKSAARARITPPADIDDRVIGNRALHHSDR
jgi:hypothetical protein